MRIKDLLLALSGISLVSIQVISFMPMTSADLADKATLLMYLGLALIPVWGLLKPRLKIELPAKKKNVIQIFVMLYTMSWALYFLVGTRNVYFERSGDKFILLERENMNQPLRFSREAKGEEYCSWKRKMIRGVSSGGLFILFFLLTDSRPRENRKKLPLRILDEVKAWKKKRKRILDGIDRSKNS